MHTLLHPGNFQADLAWANSDQQEAEWLSAYRSVWADDYSWQHPMEDLRWQRRGIDRCVYFRAGAWTTVEEKLVRGYPPCMPLEVLKQDGRPSWAHPEGVPAADWIALRRTTTGRTYIYSTAAWRRALQRHLSDWIDHYPVREVPSYSDRGDRWTTTVVCVPESVIQRAVEAEDDHTGMDDPANAALGSIIRRLRDMDRVAEAKARALSN